MESNPEEKKEGMLSDGPRGKIEYQDKRGMMHFFADDQEKADFLAEENNRDNQ